MIHNQYVFCTCLVVYLVCLGRTQNASVNLICNGDFQGHSLPLNYWGQPYNYLPSNSSCWYNKNGNQIEIKQKLQPPVSSTAQLSLLSPYILCQDLTLQAGQTYQLNFSAVNGWTMTNSTVIVWVNQNWVMNLTVLGEFGVEVGGGVFVAGLGVNRVCFDSVFSIGDQGKYAYLGPCIDNVSLVQIYSNTNATYIPSSTNSTLPNTTTITTVPNTTTSLPNLIPTTTTPIPIPKITFLISCQTHPSSLSSSSSSSQSSNQYSELSIDCSYESQGLDVILNVLIDGFIIYFQDQIQSQYQVVELGQTYMRLVVVPNRSYNVRTVRIVVSDRIPRIFNGVQYVLLFVVDGCNINFQLLEQQQISTIKTIFPIYQQITKTTHQIYTTLRSFFLSYFILNIISFWNLSLMYTFLNISTVPLFSRYFLQKLEILLFKLDSIKEWVEGRLPGIGGWLEFGGLVGVGREVVEEYRNGYVWFGYFGVSSGFLRNNSEQIFVIGLLVVKLGLLNLIARIKCLPKFVRTRLPRGLKILEIFLNQLIGVQIFMVVSATSILLNSGYADIKEKGNTLVQVITLFQGIIVIPLYFFTQMQIHKKKYLRKKRNAQRNHNRYNPPTNITLLKKSITPSSLSPNPLTPPLLPNPIQHPYPIPPPNNPNPLPPHHPHLQIPSPITPKPPIKNLHISEHSYMDCSSLYVYCVLGSGADGVVGGDSQGGYEDLWIWSYFYGAFRGSC